MALMDDRYTFIDLFSGCGGLSLGFEMAGCKCVLAVDNWKDALDTYVYNREGAEVLCEDLATIDPVNVKSYLNRETVDLIIGGPPCQGFSVAGKRNVSDERNVLYKSFVRFVEAFSPKAFVMENVPNILSIGNGVVRDAIINDFEELGYTVAVQVLNASDYGVPQNRRRAFFVGIKGTHAFQFPQPSVDRKVSVYDAISDLTECSLCDGSPYPCHANSDYQKFVRINSKGVYNHDATVHNEKTKNIISLVPDGGNYRNLPEELQKTRKVNIAWTRLNSEKPSITIDTGHRHHFHYKWNRIPTVRESARIQSFPDKFIFRCSKTSQYKQVGNAVPPLMARALAERLMSTICEEQK